MTTGDDALKEALGRIKELEAIVTRLEAAMGFLRREVAGLTRVGRAGAMTTAQAAQEAKARARILSLCRLAGTINRRDLVKRSHLGAQAADNALSVLIENGDIVQHKLTGHPGWFYSAKGAVSDEQARLMVERAIQREGEVPRRTLLNRLHLPRERMDAIALELKREGLIDIDIRDGSTTRARRPVHVYLWRGRVARASDGGDKMPFLVDRNADAAQNNTDNKSRVRE